MRKIILKIDRKHSALENAEIILGQGKQQAIFILLFAVLYLFRDLAGANIPDILFSGLCAVAFIVMDAGTSLGVYIFTTALTVPHNEIVLFYTIILLAKTFFSASVKLNGRMVIMTLGVLFLQMLNMTIYSMRSIENMAYEYITRMLIITIPLYWFNEEYTADDFRCALMCYVAGTILGGAVALLLTADLITWEALLKGTGGVRLGKTYNTEEGMQTSYNANQLAVMFAVSASILLQHIDKKRISKLVGYALLGYSFFLVFLTRSRTGLLLSALIVIIYYLILVIRRKKLFGGLLLLGLIGALAYAVLRFFPGVWEAALARFTDQEDITNGRVVIFEYYIRRWVETPWCFFFGYGIGSFFDELGIKTAPHNSIADILISWGLVGFIIIAGMLGMCFKQGAKSVDKKDRAIALLPAMIALIASMAAQYLDTGYPHPRLCFLLLATQAFAKENEPI